MAWGFELRDTGSAAGALGRARRCTPAAFDQGRGASSLRAWPMSPSTESVPARLAEIREQLKLLSDYL
jgi:hypothetical protein